MNRINLLIGSVVTATLLATTGLALSSDDDHKKSLLSWFKGTTPGIDPVDTQLYTKECGGCHFPYQPGLLPARSWETNYAQPRRPFW